MSYYKLIHVRFLLNPRTLVINRVQLINVVVLILLIIQFLRGFSTHIADKI